MKLLETDLISLILVEQGDSLKIQVETPNDISGRYKTLEFTKEEYKTYFSTKQDEVKTIFSKFIKDKKISEQDVEIYTSWLIIFDMIENFSISIYNRKGGVGKSLTTFLLSKAFSYHVHDLDPKSTNYLRLENFTIYDDRAKSKETKESKSIKNFNTPSDGKNIVDFGGDKYLNELNLLDQSDIVIFPTSTFDDIATSTEAFLLDMKELEAPTMFLFNKIERKPSKASQKRKVEEIEYLYSIFSETFEYGSNMATMPLSGAVEQLLMDRADTISIALSGGLAGSNSKIFAIALIDLYIKIILTAEGEVKA